MEAYPEGTITRKAGSRRAWSLAGAALLLGLVVLGAVALVLSPGRVRCERLGCTAPPPKERLLIPAHVYTSPTYGFSLAYSPSQGQPSHSDDSSIEWQGELSGGAVVAWTFFGTDPKGQDAKQIVQDVQNDQFPDASYVYTMPGADLGYTPGYGNVYDVSVAPNGGEAVHARLLVIAAVKRNVAVVFMGVGSYRRSTPDVDGHPNPAATPLVNLGEVEQSLKSVAFPGDPSW